MPIINPWIFYVINLLVNIGCCCFIIAFLCTVGWLISFAISAEEIGYKEFKKYLRPLAIIGVSSLIVSLVIPAKETMIQMLVASYTTPENIQTVGDTAKEGIDYLVDKVEEMLNKKD